MAHITHFGLKNFRVFKEETEIEFKPITILTGTNSSGKSSILKALHLLESNFSKFSFPMNIGKLENIDILKDTGLGAFDKIPNENTEQETFYIYLPIKFIGYIKPWKLMIEYQKGKNEFKGTLKTVSIKLPSESELFNIFSDKGYWFINVNHQELLKKYSPIFLICELQAKLEGFRRRFSAKIPKLINPELPIEESMKLHRDCSIFFGLNEEVAKTDIKFSELLNNVQPNLSVAEGDRVLIKANSTYHIEKVLHKFWSGLNSAQLDDNGCLIVDLEDYNNYDLFFDSSSSTNELKHKITLPIPWSKSNLCNLYKKFGSKIKFWDTSSSKSINSDAFLKELAYYLDSWDEKHTLKMFKIKSGHQSYFDPVFGNISTFDSIYTPNISAAFSNKAQLLNFLFKEKNLLDQEKIAVDFPNLSKVLKSNGFNYYFFAELYKDIIKSDLEFSLSKAIEDMSILNPSYKAVNHSVFNEQLLLDFSVLNSSEGAYKKRVLEFLDFSVKHLGIGDKIEVVSDNLLSDYIPVIIKDGKKRLLFQEGHGISKVFPSLLQIVVAIIQQKDTIILEEPEANLHPALQSKFADIILLASKKYGLQFIIETHSEYLIRKLQYLTAKQEVKPEDSIIYYFYPPNKVPDGEPQVKKINIEKDGRLSDEFGTGFFDESANLMMSLLTGESLN